MSQAKIFKLLSEAYGLTWSGGIAAEVIDGCPVTLKEDRYYVQVSAYMPERVYEAKHEIFNEQMKAVKGVKCGFDKKTSRITTVLSQPNRVVEQYGALREIIKQYAAPYVEEDKCPYCGQGECDMAAIYNNQYRRVHVRCHQYHTDRTRDVVLSGQGNLAMGIIGALAGAVLFMAIALAIGIFAERSYGWFFVLATFAALGGYKLFHGPYGRTGMVTVTLCSILSMVLYLFCEMVYLIAQYYELAIGEVLKQWPAVIQIAFSPDNLAESWFQLIFFLGGLAWFLIKRPLSKQKVVIGSAMVFVFCACKNLSLVV